jgi:transposase-like protein
MEKERLRPERILEILREVDLCLTRGQSLDQICGKLRISRQTYHRWRYEFGEIEVSQAKRFKELQKENSRLKRSVAELTLDKLILKEALEENTERLLMPTTGATPSKKA